MRHKDILKLLLVLLLQAFFHGGQARDSIYIRALKDEVQRSMDSLVLNGVLPPGFISYHIVDASILDVHAVNGGIIRSQQRRIARFDNRILILSDGKSNENYLDLDNLGSWSRHEINLPVTGTADDVRRQLWLVTDENYKNAVATYESKLSAIRQQNLSREELELPDFLPAEPNKITIAHLPVGLNQKLAEDLARDISAEFAMSAKIYTSQVNIFVYDGQVYYHNSEGTLASYPFQLTAVLATAAAQSSSGELLFEHALHFARDLSDLPSREKLISEAREIAGYIERTIELPSIDEPYFGPVLFEGQAVAEAFARVFFAGTDGLVAIRKPIIGDEQIIRFAQDFINENNLEPMVGRRVVSRYISIDALPVLDNFNGEKLFGSYLVDAEGLPALEKLNLIEEGVLNNLLSTRVPTLRIRESNAHARLALNRGSVTTVTAPGVVKMTLSEEVLFDTDELKKLLIRRAIDEGLEYAYIVRKVVSPAARFAQEDELIFRRQTVERRDLPKTIRVYRVYVEDGREEPVSMAEVTHLSVRSFRRVLGASKQMQVYNTMYCPVTVPLYRGDFGLTGVPVSYIVPQALLFEELDLVRESQQVIRKPPVVGHPASY